MATIKVKFRPSSVRVKEGTVYYQVIHNRMVRQISTGYRIHSSEWDCGLSHVFIPSNADSDRHRYLASIVQRINEDISRIKILLARLDCSGQQYTAGHVIELYHSLASVDNGFVSYCQCLIGKLKQIGKIRTAETYTAALNSFRRFRGDSGDVPLDVLDSTLMVGYEIYLKNHGVCQNSSSYYMRNLRAMYNRAVENELVPQRHPFKHVYTGIGKTVKRAVPVQVIRQIRDMDLALNPSMDYARDIFMFSFYTRGMSFVDIAFLKKTDLQNGVLSYRRQKTHQRLFIKWEPPMQKIIDKYDTKGSPYLLPIIKSAEKDERRQYKSAEHLINNKLKKIGVQLGLVIPLTTYVARHGWASIAKSKNIPVSTISEAMGHDSENTTRIYLASLDTSIVDNANSLIIKSL